MDEDKAELLERRLSEKVAERVRPALFRVYAAMGAAVIAVLGFVGWDIVSDIKAEIKQEIKAEIQDSIVADIKAKRTEIIELIAETKYLAKQANTIVIKLEKQIREFEPQAAQLDETITKVKALSVDAKNIAAMYAIDVKPLAENFDVLSGQVKALAEQVGQLDSKASGSTGLMAMDTPPNTAITAIISRTSEVQQQFQARNRASVFFQFTGASQARAKELASALKAAGYIVPDEDRESQAAGKHEVRFFHEADKGTAAKLVQDATRILRDLDYPGTAGIKAVSYVSYPNKKPREGVIELWLDLSGLSARQAN